MTARPMHRSSNNPQLMDETPDGGLSARAEDLNSGPITGPSYENSSRLRFVLATALLLVLAGTALLTGLGDAALIAITQGTVPSAWLGLATAVGVVTGVVAMLTTWPERQRAHVVSRAAIGIGIGLGAWGVLATATAAAFAMG